MWAGNLEQRKLGDRYLWTAGMVVLIALWSYPPFLMIVTAFKTEPEILANPFAAARGIQSRRFHEDVEHSQLRRALLEQPSLFCSRLDPRGGARNRSRTCLQLPIRSPGAFAFFVLLLTTLMLPQQTVVIPLFSSCERFTFSTPGSASFSSTGYACRSKS